MKQRRISTHLHISIALSNSPSLCLNFLLNAGRENCYLHTHGRSSARGAPPPPPLLSVFRYLFVYSSFASGVNNFNVTVCCCRAALNLHVSDDKYPKTKMLIAPANQHSPLGSSVRCRHRYLLRPPAAAAPRATHPPHQLPIAVTGAGDDGVYALDPPLLPGHQTLIFMLADKGNYFLIAWRNVDTSGR